MIINHEELCIAIREVEECVKEYSMQERLMIFAECSARIRQSLQDTKMKDSLFNLPFKGLMKKAMKQDD